MRSIEVFGRPLPWLTQSYMGALKSQVFVPVLAAASPSPRVVRLATLAIALAGLAFAMAFTRHAFDGPGDHEVHAVAISADGVLATASLPLVVRARTGEGCAAGGGSGREGIAILLLALLLFRIGAAGNRPGPAPRS